MPPITRQKNDGAAEENSESSTAEDTPPTSNLQELQAKIAALEQQLELEMAKNVSNNVSAENNTGGDALSNTDGGNVPLYKRQSFNQENANDRVAFGLLVGQHHYGAGGMYISFTTNDEGLPRLKAMHSEVPEGMELNSLQDWNNPDGVFPAATLIMMLFAHRELKLEYEKSFMNTFGSNIYSTSNSGDTTPTLPGYVCEFLSLGTNKLVAASHAKMDMTLDETPATSAQLGDLQKDAFALHEITRRLMINAVQSPKENQDIQTAASMQQLAANLDSANSKESEKVSEGITLTKFLDCIKETQAKTTSSKKNRNRRTLAFTPMEMNALVKMINDCDVSLLRDGTQLLTNSAGAILANTNLVSSNTWQAVYRTQAPSATPNSPAPRGGGRSRVAASIVDGKFDNKITNVDKGITGIDSMTVGEKIMHDSNYSRLVAPSSTADQPRHNGANVADVKDLEAKYKAPIPQNYVRSAIFAPFMEAAKDLNLTLQKDEKALLSQLNALEKQVSNVLREYLLHRVKIQDTNNKSEMQTVSHAILDLFDQYLELNKTEESMISHAVVFDYYTMYATRNGGFGEDIGSVQSLIAIASNVAYVHLPYHTTNFDSLVLALLKIWQCQPDKESGPNYVDRVSDSVKYAVKVNKDGDVPCPLSSPNVLQSFVIWKIYAEISRIPLQFNTSDSIKKAIRKLVADFKSKYHSKINDEPTLRDDPLIFVKIYGSAESFIAKVRSHFSNHTGNLATAKHDKSSSSSERADFLNDLSQVRTALLVISSGGAEVDDALAWQHDLDGEAFNAHANGKKKKSPNGNQKKQYDKESTELESRCIKLMKCMQAYVKQQSRDDEGWRDQELRLNYKDKFLVAISKEILGKHFDIETHRIKSKTSFLDELKEKMKTFANLRELLIQDGFLMPVYNRKQKCFPLERDERVSTKLSTPVQQNNGETYHPKFKKGEITTVLNNIHEMSVEKNQFVKYITFTWPELGSIAGEDTAKVKSGFRLTTFACMGSGSQAYYGAAADDDETDDRDTHDDPAPKSSKSSKTNEKQVSANDDWDEEAEENFQTLLKSRQANKAAKRQQAKQVFAAMSLEDRKLALADAQRERVEEASKKLTKETLEASKKLTKEASKMLTTADDDDSEVASNDSN